MGRFEDGVSRRSRSIRRHGIDLLESDVNELAQAKGANVAGLQGGVRHVTASTFDDIDVFYLAGGFGRHLRRRIGAAHRPDPDDSGRSQDRPGRQRRDRRRDASRCSRGRSARELEETGAAGRALPAGDASALLRFLRRRLPVQAPSNRRAGGGADDRARRTSGRTVDVAAGRVHAAARLSARTPARRPGRGAGRRGRRPGTPNTAGRGSIAREASTLTLDADGVRLDGAALRQRAPAPVAGRRRGAPRGAGRGERRARARSGSAAAVAGREARRVLLPRSLRLRGRRAPGDASRRPPVRLGRDAGPGGAAALQPRLSGVGHRRAGRAPRAAHGLRGAAAGPARGARLRHAAAEEVAARRVRPDRATSSALAHLRDLVPCESCSFAPVPVSAGAVSPRRAAIDGARVRRADPDDAVGDDAIAAASPGSVGGLHRQREGAAPLGRRAPDADAARRRNDRRAVPLRRHDLHEHGPPAALRLPRAARPARRRLSHPRRSAAGRRPTTPGTRSCAATSASATT